MKDRRYCILSFLRRECCMAGTDPTSKFLAHRFHALLCGFSISLIALSSAGPGEKVVMRRDCEARCTLTERN
jgi:hypothetical protein